MWSYYLTEKIKFRVKNNQSNRLIHVAKSARKSVLSRLFSVQSFIRNIGWILCITGLAKLITAFGHTPIIREYEPIMQIQFRWLFVLVGSVELLIAAYCILSKKPTSCLLMIAWLSAIFSAYRLSLFWVGWKLPCPCLGNVMPTLHISPIFADMIMKIVVVYMLVGSCIHISLRWLQKTGRISYATPTQ
jgi:hypothetical protein